MFKPFYRMYDAADDTGDGTSGGTGDKGDPAEARFAAIENSIKAMANGMTGFATKMDEFIGNMSSQNQSRQDDDDQRRQSAPADDDIDLEQLSRKDFSLYLTNKIVSAITGGPLKEIGGKLEAVSSKVDHVTTKTEIEKFASTKPDFYEWGEELRALLKDNPYLSPKQAYTLVRDSNAQKSDEMDKKHKLGKYANGTTGGKPPTFLGFTPSSGGTSHGTQRMNPAQAAEQAWNDAFSGTQFQDAESN